MRRWTCDFPPTKTPLAQKYCANFHQEKMAFSTPRQVALGLPSSSFGVCTGGRAGGRTLTSQPKFLASMGYQIFLSMVVCRCSSKTKTIYIPKYQTLNSEMTMDWPT